MNGNGGTDTLNATLATSVTPTALTNIEVINATFNDTDGLTLGLANAGQVTNVNNVGTALTSGRTVNITGIAADAALGLNNVSNGTTNFQYAVTAGTQDVALTLTDVSNAAVAKIAGVESVTITSAGESNDAVLTAASAQSVTIVGDADITLGTTGTLSSSLFDASEATGNVDLTVVQQTAVPASTDISVLGGSGDDGLDVSAVTSSDVSVNAGAGDDVVIDTAATLNDSIDGGLGNDALQTTSTVANTLAASTPTTYNITNIEELIISNKFDDGATALKLTNIATGINTLSLINDTNAEGLTAGAESVTGGAGTLTVNLGDDTATNASLGLAGTTTFTDTGSGATDNLYINNTYVKTSTGASQDIFASQEIDSVGYENVFVNTGLANQTIHTVSIAVDSVNGGASFTASGLGSLTGNAGAAAVNLTTDSQGQLTVDASGLTAQANGAKTLWLTVSGQGTGGTAVVTGSAGVDYIATHAGNKATVDGGAGNDSITGSTSVDALYGGTGNDTIKSGGGNDVLKGNEGDDALTLTAAAGVAASLDGGAGNDTLDVSGYLGKSQTLDGGEGVDTLTVTSADLGTTFAGFTTAQQATLKGNINNVEVLNVSDATAITFDVTKLVDTTEVTKFTFGGANTGTYQNLASNSTVELKAASNNATFTVKNAATGTADELNVTLTKKDGSTDFGTVTANNIETVDVSSGANDGTTRTHTLVVSADSVESMTLTGSNNLVLTASAATDLASVDATALTGTLNLTASSSTTANTITLGNKNSTVTAGAGADSITGGAGNDSLYGNAGADTILGGAGNDTIDGGNAADSLSGGTGEDVIWTSAGADTIDGGDGTDTLKVTTSTFSNLTGYTLTGLETLDMNSIATTLSINQFTNNFTDYSNASAGLTFSDAGTVTANADVSMYTLANGTNNFTTTTLGSGVYSITGGTGNDTINSTVGNLIASGSTATVAGGTGALDTINLSDDTAVTVTTSHISGVEYINFSNVTTNVSFVTGDGMGISGATVQFDASSLTTGTLNFDGSGETDAYAFKVLNGSAEGTSTIKGGYGADTILGGTGNDLITAGRGNDYVDLTQGGADDVIFSAYAVNGIDTIVGFTSTVDDLDIADLQSLQQGATSSTTLVTGTSLAKADVQTAAFASGQANATSNGVIVILDQAAADWSDVGTVVTGAITASATAANNALLAVIVDNGTDTRIYNFYDTTNGIVFANDFTQVATITGVQVTGFVAGDFITT